MRWLRFINNFHRRSTERRTRTFVILVALIYSWSTVPRSEGGQIFPDSQSPWKSRDICENSFRRTLGPVQFSDPDGWHLRGSLVITNHVIPRLSAAVFLRDNLLTILSRILLQCLTNEMRVSFETLHDAIRSRHIPVYDVLPILPMNRGKSIKHQIYAILQIIERIGSPFVIEYASLAKAFVNDDAIELNSLSSNDLLLSIDNETITAISLDKELKLDVPLTEEEAFAQVMYSLRNGLTDVRLSIVAALMSNIPNFDTTNPEVPGALRFVADYMNDNSKIDDPLLDFTTIDQLDGPDVLVKTVLERIEVAEFSSDVLRESVGILLTSFDTKPWDRASKIGSNEFAENIFDTITHDYYPSSVVAVAKYLKQHRRFKNSLKIERTFYDSDTDVTLELLTRLEKGEGSTKKLYKSLKLLQSFASQRYNYHDLSRTDKPVGFHEVSKHLSTFVVPFVSRQLMEAAENLRSILSEDLPWSFAYKDKTSSANPWKLMVNALVNLRNTPVSRDLAAAIDNMIFHARSSNLLGKSSVLYRDLVVFQRSDSSHVELNMYSLLRLIPGIFDDNRLTPLLVFVAKTNFLEYLGYEFNKFEYTEPRRLLLAMLKRALEIPAVRSIKPLLRALSIAQDHLDKPLKIIMYTTEELQKLLEIFPKIHEDPRYLPLKILFKKENLFLHLSPNFTIADSNSTAERVKFILSTVALKPIEYSLAESIDFALSNAEGLSLPARAFTRQDFVYLTNQLLKDSNDSMAILRSPLYQRVADWRPSMRGSPKIILSRILNYPVEELSENLELAKIVSDAEVSLNEDTVTKVDILKRGTLDSIIDEFPENTDFRIVKLLFENPNLALLMPKLNVTKLDDLEPREALKELLEHSISSPNIKSEKLLLKHLVSALKVMNQSRESNRTRDTLETCLKETLIDPFNRNFDPLMRQLDRKNYRGVAFSKKLKILRHSLYKIRDNGRTSSLGRAARLALAQVFADENDYSLKRRRIDKGKIDNALKLLPKEAKLEPLRRLLTFDWILGVLPADLKTSKIRKPTELLRSILSFTKDNYHVRQNCFMLKTIYLAEMALGGWKLNVSALRPIINTVEAVVYDPAIALLEAKNLKKMNITLRMNSSGSTKLELLNVLDRVSNNSRIRRDNKVLRSLESIRRDVMAFGADIDLTSMLDDLGVVDNSELKPLMNFLQRNDVALKFGPIVFSNYEPKRRFAVLLKLLEDNREVRSDRMLRRGLNILRSVGIEAIEPPGTKVADLVEILSTIPTEIKAKHPKVQKLFTENTLKRVAGDDDIRKSQEPLMTLLSKLLYLPDTLTSYSVATELVAVYEEIDRRIKIPFVMDFQTRPLVRELHNIQRKKIDFVDKLIVPQLSFVNVTDPNDNVAALHTAIEGALLKNGISSDPELRSKVLSFQKDLELVAGPHRAAKGELTSAMIRNIIDLIPSGILYDPIKSMIETREIFNYSRNIINWQRYPSAQEKLGAILNLMENTTHVHQHERSFMQLRLYLTSQFDFISKEDMKFVKNELYNVSGNVDLVPLKLFVTRENFMKYLPKNLTLNHRLRNATLTDILDILRKVPSLRRRENLYASMTNTRRILHENQSIRRLASDGKSEKSITLKSYDLRFIFALKINDSDLKRFLAPKKMIRLLPKDFELSSRLTFKAKARHLLRQLIVSDKEIRKKLQQLLRRVELLPDVPSISDEELRPLIDIIPRETIPSFAPIRKLLRATTLTRLLPGDFEIRSFNDSKVALREVLKILELSIGGKNKNLERTIYALRRELKKKKSKILRERSTIGSEELRSLIDEIPFDKYPALCEIKENFTEDKVLSLLPREFDVYALPTKKSRLLAILDAIATNSMSGEMKKSIKIIINLVTIMPDAPRIRDADVPKALSIIPLSARDSRTLMVHCSVEKLGSRLPIHFDISRFESRKDKISVLLKYCEETQSPQGNLAKALANAMTLAKKLPTADPTNSEVNEILGELNCGNFRLTKPLKTFLSRVNVAPLLPWNFNLESQSTFKQRIESLLKALSKIRQLKFKRYKKAIKMFETMARKMPDIGRISENDLKELRELEAMRDTKSKLCSEYLTLPNVLKAIPPSFDIDKFPSNESKLFAVLLRINSTHQLRSDRALYDSCRFVDGTLSRDLGKRILHRLRVLINDTEEYLPLKFFILSKEDKIFNGTSLPRGYENENFNDTLRIFLKSLLKTGGVLRSRTLADSILKLIADLPRFNATKFDIDEATAEIPKSKSYESLKIFLDCSDVRNDLYKFTSVPSDYTPKLLLRDILKNLRNSSMLDRQTVNAVEELKKKIEREIWDQEIVDMFKELKDHDNHMAKLEAIGSFFTVVGPVKLLGHDYREKYPNKMDRLKALSEKLINLPDRMKKPELQRSLEYLMHILKNDVPTGKSGRSIADINLRSLLVALPKTEDERMILGVLRFFTDLRLRDLDLPRNPYDYKTKGALLEAIFLKALSIKSLKLDSLQFEALNYYRNKIISDGPGEEPIELKNDAEKSTIDVDFLGLLKALETSAVNSEAVVKIVRFFDTEYDGMLHGLGFDQATYRTRGLYLKAFLLHLIGKPAVPREVRLNAELLLPAVRLKGLGAEPVDVNDGIVPYNRMFTDQPISGWSPKLQVISYVSSRNLPATSNPTYPNDGHVSDVLESDRATTKGSIHKIPNSEATIPQQNYHYNGSNDKLRINFGRTHREIFSIPRNE